MAVNRTLEGPSTAAFQRPDGQGFVYQGRQYPGFADHPELPLPVRKQIARWASALKIAAEDQRLLAELPVNEVVRSPLREMLDREDEFLGSEILGRTMARLPASERRAILRPQSKLGRDFVWPLRAREAAAVLSHVSENQLRDWDDAGLVPALRWGSGGYRGYFRSQLVLAVLVAEAIDKGWSIQRIKQAVGLAKEPDPAPVSDFVGVYELSNSYREAMPSLRSSRSRSKHPARLPGAVSSKKGVQALR